MLTKEQPKTHKKQSFPTVAKASIIFACALACALSVQQVIVACGGGWASFGSKPFEFAGDAHSVFQSQWLLEETTTATLPPDDSFITSKEYKEMEKFVKRNYDLDVEALRTEFQNKGFIIFDPKIPEDVLDEAQAFTQDVWDLCRANPNPPDECRSYHQDRFADQKGVNELAQHFNIRAMIAVLHGHNPYPFQTLNYPGTSLARTHSDYIHFAANPLPLMSACWVALIDVDPNAGPVFYYEGSHKLPPYNMQDFGLEDREQHVLNYAKYQDVMTAAMKKMGFEYKEVVIPRGWALIWSANLVHGGPPAKKQGLQRLSQVTHYFFRNSNYNWAPVASDVEKNKIVYYDEEMVDRKWSDEGTPEERRAMSKFRSGTCTTFTDDIGRPDIVSPCTFNHRIPTVMSDIFEHRGEKENDVIM